MSNTEQEVLVQKIRTQYTKKEPTQLDQLKALDKKVKQPVNVFSYIFGSISALVMGTGMCFAMNVIEPGTYYGITIGENMMLPGIVVGLAGIIMASLTYPLHKVILNRRKKKYAPQILALSDDLLVG